MDIGTSSFFTTKESNGSKGKLIWHLIAGPIQTRFLVSE